jgi:predicted AlkP superfamily phosphohydrolase/phosphomutase
MRKVMVIGLDCMTPQLAFEQWPEDLPNISRLRATGVWGPLKSCDPPITVPAWASMLSSKNPGRLGFYGFRNRADYSYDKLTVATSNVVKEDRVWDTLSRAGKDVILISVPQTYPPRPVRGFMISCFLTPDVTHEYTYPREFKSEVESVVGEYIFDVNDFRSDNKDNILRQIHTMTGKRFQLARHLVQSKPWDFFMMVEMGVDRIHHAFWKYMDSTHRKHEPGNRYQNAIRDYYRYVDQETGELLKCVPEDTTVLVVSDHGAQKMEGGICVNEWLMQNNYLKLLEPPVGVTPLARARVNWAKTIAWGEGGYYARIFLNVKGREPQGLIDPDQYQSTRAALIERLEALGDEHGRPIGTKVYRAEELYPETRGVAPDLIAYFGNLAWRSVGSIGSGRIHTFENDTGPDDANHAPHGIFVMHDRRRPIEGFERADLQLMDVAPTILNLLDVPIPGDMEGKVVTFDARAADSTK